MTIAEARKMGADHAREAYRQCDGADEAAEVVMRYARRLDIMMRAAGALLDVHDDLYLAAGETFRSEAETLFGFDHVVAGQ